jgi:hypothetical protein
LRLHFVSGRERNHPLPASVANPNSRQKLVFSMAIELELAAIGVRACRGMRGRVQALRMVVEDPDHLTLQTDDGMSARNSLPAAENAKGKSNGPISRADLANRSPNVTAQTAAQTTTRGDFLTHLFAEIGLNRVPRPRREETTCWAERRTRRELAQPRTAPAVMARPLQSQPSQHPNSDWQCGIA